MSSELTPSTPNAEGKATPIIAPQERLRRRRRKRYSLNHMIPNMLTILALCAGLSAIRYALLQKWEYAAVAILIAAILDGLDGRIARLLKGTSKFGAELDSLSDFICFGVAPALILYLWSLTEAAKIGWILAMLYAVCSALRLARFNTALEDEDLPAWTSNYFTGVPAPAGAGLVMLPMILSFLVGDEYARMPEITMLSLVIVGGLFVCSLPTFSFKKIRVPHNLVLPTMVSVGLLAAALISATWATMAVILIVYLLTMPFSYRAHQSQMAKWDAANPSDGDADDDAAYDEDLDGED